MTNDSNTHTSSSLSQNAAGTAGQNNLSGQDDGANSLIWRITDIAKNRKKQEKENDILDKVDKAIRKEIRKWQRDWQYGSKESTCEAFLLEKIRGTRTSLVGQRFSKDIELDRKIIKCCLYTLTNWENFLDERVKNNGTLKGDGQDCQSKDTVIGKDKDRSEDGWRISPKDIYASLWKCREFELSHLWQRSIFLTAFLAMCFPGYGTLLLKICTFDFTSGPKGGFVILNCTALFVALVGVLLSVMWIMMGKGSKDWYEKYEYAIEQIERDPKYSEWKVVHDMDFDRMMHGSLPGAYYLDNRIWSTKAGKYSPSRINIGIGQVSLFVWLAVYIIHALIFLFSAKLRCFVIQAEWPKLVRNDVRMLAVIVFAIFLIAVAGCTYLLYRAFKSRYKE